MRPEELQGSRQALTPHTEHPTMDVTLPRFCGRVKASNILYQKESKDYGKSPKDLYAGV
jgi:hypothetical protein